LGILRTAVFTLSGYVLFAVFRFAIGLMLPGVTTEFRLSPTEAGVFASAPLLATVLTMGFAGYISDRLNRKLVFSMGLLILWVGALLSAVSPTYLSALVFVFIAGAGAGFLPPTTYTIMGNLRPQSRAALTGMTATVYNIGGFVGSVVLGVIISLSGWRFALGGLAALGLIYLPLMFFLMGPIEPGRQASTARPERPSYFDLLKSKNNLFAGASLFMSMYASFAVLSWAPTYLASIGIGSSLAGGVIGVFSLAGAAAAFTSGRLGDAWGEKRIIVATGAIGGVVSVLLLVSPANFVTMLILVVLLGLLVWPSWNLITSMVQRPADPAAVGSITGLVQNIGMIGGFLGPIVTGTLVVHYGLGTVLLGSVAVTLWLYALLILPFEGGRKRN
jgi:YNFM family putative membrane transporter